MNNPTPAEIKQSRKDAGLTQTQAAALIGKTLSAWQRWEYGSRKMDSALFELFTIKLEDRKMTISYENWKKEFKQISEQWTAENKTRIPELTDTEIAEIGDEIQADAYSGAGGERLELTDWPEYDESCTDRDDFQAELKFSRDGEY